MADTIQYYSNVEDVLEDCGLGPEDMGFTGTDDLTPEQQLTAKVEKWLVETKADIDANRERDFHQEEADGDIERIPQCIHNIAKRITINRANAAKLNRKSPVIKVNEYSVKPVTDNPMTPEIKADLETCAPAELDSTESGSIRFFTINGLDDCE